MGDKSDGKTLLENAYRLSTPADNEAYYNTLADSYDHDFADGLGYGLPGAIARLFHVHAGDGNLPVADIGCGTGLVANALALPAGQIDGMDISTEMLRIARDKGVYRALYQVDLIGSLDAIRNDYGAVVSAGTFTHGHLGPEPLAGLLDIARSGALFVIAANTEHYRTHKFDVMLDRLHVAGVISPPKVESVPIYSKTGHDHSGDTGLVLIYHKT